MRASPIVLSLSVAILVGLTVGLAPPTASYHAEEPQPPSSEECNRLTDGQVFVGFDGFEPGCVLVDEGQAVTWTNLGHGWHEPGEGVRDRPHPRCWEAGPIGTAETSSAEFHLEYSPFYEEQTLVVRNITIDGDLVEDRRVCDPDHVPIAFNDEGDLGVRYKCFVHYWDDSRMAWILLDVG